MARAVRGLRWYIASFIPLVALAFVLLVRNTAATRAGLLHQI